MKAKIFGNPQKVLNNETARFLTTARGFAILLRKANFKTTASREARNLELNKYVKDYKREAVTSLALHGILMEAKTLPDLRESVSTEKGNISLQLICGLPKAPSVSQLSRILNIIDLTFLKHLLKDLLKQHRHLTEEKNRVDSLTGQATNTEAIEPLIADIDGSLVKLNKYLEFASYGYDPRSKSKELGAKLTLGTLDGVPAAVDVAPGNQHDSASFNPVYLKLKHLVKDEREQMLLLFDKGYFKYDRLDKLCDDDTRFIPPRKKYSLNRVDYHLQSITRHEGWTIAEYQFKHEDMDHALRWVYATNGEEEFDLLTNVMELSPVQVTGLYTLRWEIEVLFKTAKQVLGLESPFVRSFHGFLAFVYLVMIAYLLLAVYAEHLGMERPYPFADLLRDIRYTMITVEIDWRKPPPQVKEEEFKGVIFMQ